jgi:DNA-binding MarR family transcriptional regulator
MPETIPNSDAEPLARIWRLTSWLLHHASAAGSRLVAQHFGDAGSRMSYAILAGIAQFGTLSQAELCRRIGVDRGDAVAVLNDLERDGLARRFKDPADPRRNAVEITPTGQQRLAELDERVEEAQEKLLERLSPKQREQLRELLRLVIGLSDVESSS